MKILWLMFVLCLASGVSASVDISLYDTLDGADTEFLIYNASGASMGNISSNGGTISLESGSYVVQVMPVDPGYRADPLKLVYILFGGISFFVLLIGLLMIGAGLVKLTKTGVGRR